MEIKKDIVFVDGSLKEEFDRFLEAAQPYIEMAKKIAEHKDVMEHDFDAEEIEKIDQYAESLNEAFTGDISESGWFYLREEEEFVNWVTGDTGFNFTTFTYDDID